MGHTNLLSIFEAHGVEFTGSSGDQMYGYCPFSGKENKFYVNKSNGLWDSKTAGMSGNVYKFLEQRSRSYRAEITTSLMRRLAENRQLPRDAFRDWEIGWDGSRYTWPTRNIENSVVDIRRFAIRTKLIRGTSGCKVGLFGSHRLRTRPSETVYICEGEWDAIALHWLLRTLDEPGVVVGVPGANTFKNEWARWLSGRDVVTLYDADPQGEEGMKKAHESLSGIASSIRHVHWPDEWGTDEPKDKNGVGWKDTRDWIVRGTTLSKRPSPEICWEKLQKLFRSSLRSKTGEVVEQKPKEQSMAERRWMKSPPTIEQLHDQFNKWLLLKTTDNIDVMLATTLSQRLDGSPVWMFLVGPPGSAKTAIALSLSDTKSIRTVSSLTAHSLISGAAFTQGGDPSLIPQLNEKTLVVKDFTSIMSQQDREQKEIFGILRDAYDGNCTKVFGNGITRTYTSRFTVLAAVTPKIYDLGESHASLGERFLKFTVTDNMLHESEDEIIARAIENSDRETVMREELRAVVKAFLEKTRAKVASPDIPTLIRDKIIALAKFGAHMRGTVSRNTYHNDIMTSRPMREVGSRLGQQLSKLARGLAMVHGRKHVNEDDYTIVKKVMLDTISQRNEDVLRSLIMAMGGVRNLEPLSVRQLAMKTHYPFATIQRLIDDMKALGLVKRIGAGVGSKLTVSPELLKEINDADLYTTPAEISRVVSRKIRVKLRRVKPQPRKIRIVLSNNGNGVRPNISIPLAPSVGAPEVRRVQ